MKCRFRGDFFKLNHTIAVEDFPFVLNLIKNNQEEINELKWELNASSHIRCERFFYKFQHFLLRNDLL